MESKAQVALEEERMAILTSSVVAGEKEDSKGGGEGGKE
jgi:hypothetical protein